MSSGNVILLLYVSYYLEDRYNMKPSVSLLCDWLAKNQITGTEKNNA